MALKIKVSSSVSLLETENSFNPTLTIGALKTKLELITGAQANTIELTVFNKDNEFVCKLDDNNKTLAEYPIENSFRLHVLDTSGTKIENVETVKKLEISDEEYALRKDSVRAFKQKMKFGQFSEETEEEKAEKLKKEEEKAEKLKKEEEKLKSIKIGDRCQVTVVGQPRKRGVIRYIGETDFKAGKWVGVAYDEPLGKHDGSVSGTSYFSCPNKHGAFVKAECVEVGDFPEIGLEDEEL